MLLYANGSPTLDLTPEAMKTALFGALDRLGSRSRVLVLPPDISRFHSQAGFLTQCAWEYYGDRLVDVLPAIGTHDPVSEKEIGMMFGGVPPSLFRAHDFRRGTVTLGDVPADYVRDVSAGAVDYPIPVQVSRWIAEGGHDLILSVGQVVPHEVIGMANYTKNVFVGTGGAESISRTHYLGAAYGMERIMGRADTPVRRVLSYGADKFARHLPIVYVLTVVGLNKSGGLSVRGLFIGNDDECFKLAATLSLAVNFELLDKPLRKVVVYLDPSEYKSTWLGNKSIYRTRMAIADSGELVVLAPGVHKFGEDAAIDALIRKYGYAGTQRVLALVRRHRDLQENLGAAAHLIHGSSEGRFEITYCPGHLTREEIEGVHFRYADLAGTMARYDPGKLKDGVNVMDDGEEVYFISNPALGLWAHKGRFSSS